MEEHEKIELRSEEVQEILGTPPRWIIRWGTTIIVLGIIILFYFSYLIKYPDVVPVRLEITTSIEPVQLVAEESGHMLNVFVEEDSEVSYGDILVVIQNPANLEDVLFLDSLAVELQLYSIQDFVAFDPPADLKLGNLQSDYSAFIRLFEDFTNVVSSGYDAQRLRRLDREIGSIKSSILSLEDKLDAARNELKIRDAKVETLQKLYSEKVGSFQALQDASAERAALQRQMKGVISEIADKRISITQIESEKTNLSLVSDESQKNKFVELQQQINKLKSEIEIWKRKYLLIAPLQGTVSFASEYRSKKTYITKNEVVMSIVPSEGKTIIGKANLPTSGLGKVDLGNKVIIRVDGYPYQEWGVVVGTLATKGQIPNKDREYPITVDLPNGLVTTINKPLRFDQQMQGMAEIVSKDRRFIERVFYQLRGLWGGYDY